MSTGFVGTVRKTWGAMQQSLTTSNVGRCQLLDRLRFPLLKKIHSIMEKCVENGIGFTRVHDFLHVVDSSGAPMVIYKYVLSFQLW